MNYKSSYEDCQNYTDIRKSYREMMRGFIDSGYITYTDDTQSTLDMMFDCIFNAGRNYQMDRDYEMIQKRYGNK